MIISILVVFFSIASATSVYDIRAMSGDGSDYSATMSEAWSEACQSSDPSTIYVPRGRYLLKSMVHMEGPCNNNAITILVNGTLVAPSGYGDGRDYVLLLERVDGVKLHGGSIDGRGSDLWECKNNGNNDCPTGATNVGIVNSQNVAVVKLKSVNSQLFHFVVNGCQNVRVRGVKILASGESPNTDGIHVQYSTGIIIANLKAGTGDDCVSIGPGAVNVGIRNVICGPGHGISIGSLGRDRHEEGVENVTVNRVRFIGTQNGLRIKTWAQQSDGYVNRVVFRDAVMDNVENPILIDQNYCPGGVNCPGGESGIRISNIKYKNIQGTSATEVAVKFDCSDGAQCEGITLDNINLKYGNQRAQTSCSNVVGTEFDQVEPTGCLSH